MKDAKREIRIVDGAILIIQKKEYLDNWLLLSSIMFVADTMATRAYRFNKAPWFDRSFDNALWTKISILLRLYKKCLNT